MTTFKLSENERKVTAVLLLSANSKSIVRVRSAVLRLAGILMELRGLRSAHQPQNDHFCGRNQKRIGDDALNKLPASRIGFLKFN